MNATLKKYYAANLTTKLWWERYVGRNPGPPFPFKRMYRHNLRLYDDIESGEFLKERCVHGGGDKTFGACEGDLQTWYKKPDKSKGENYGLSVTLCTKHAIDWDVVDKGYERGESTRELLKNQTKKNWFQRRLKRREDRGKRRVARRKRSRDTECCMFCRNKPNFRIRSALWRRRFGYCCEEHAAMYMRWTKCHIKKI